jgi:hypothetical protein
MIVHRGMPARRRESWVWEHYRRDVEHDGTWVYKCTVPNCTSRSFKIPKDGSTRGLIAHLEVRTAAISSSCITLRHTS